MAHLKEQYIGSPPSRAGPTAPTKAYVWYVILVFAVVNFFNYMDRFALSVLAPSIKKDFQLTDTQLGLLTGFAFAICYAICAVPIGRFADRSVRRNVIAVALTTWSIMTALSGAAQNFWHLFLARIGVGAGEAGGLAPAQSILCDYVPLEQRPIVFAVHNLGFVLGMMGGLAIAGWLADAVGWRLAFVAMGLPGILVALLIILTVKEPVRGFYDARHKKADSKPSLGEVARFLWQCKTYRFIALAAVASGFVNNGTGQWWASFFNRTHDLSLSTLGASLGLATGLGAAVGLLGGGVIASIASKRDVRLPLAIAAIANIFAALTGLGYLLVPSAATSIFLLGLQQACLNASIGAITTAMYSVVQPDMRTTGGTILYFFAAALGFGFGPATIGLISDLLEPSYGEQSLRYALVAGFVLFPVLIGALFAAARTFPADLKAVGAI